MFTRQKKNLTATMISIEPLPAMKIIQCCHKTVNDDVNHFIVLRNELAIVALVDNINLI